jgi:hypothetical protein
VSISCCVLHSQATRAYRSTPLHAYRVELLILVSGYTVVLESGHISSTVAGIVLIYSLSFCEALTFLARAHADVSARPNTI